MTRGKKHREGGFVVWQPDKVAGIQKPHTGKGWKSGFSKNKRNKKKTINIDMSQKLPDSDEELFHLANCLQMTASRKQMYQSFQQQLTEAIHTTIQDLGIQSDEYKIQPFGSFGAELALQVSDLDLVILTRSTHLYDRQEKINLFKKIKKKFNKKNYSQIKYIVIQARFPILKVTKQDLQIDLSVESPELILQRLQITKDYQLEFSNFRTIYLIVHDLMVRNQLGSNQSGGIGGWALQQMIYVAMHAYSNNKNNNNNAHSQICTHNNINNATDSQMHAYNNNSNNTTAIHNYIDTVNNINNATDGQMHVYNYNNTNHNQFRTINNTNNAIDGQMHAYNNRNNTYNNQSQNDQNQQILQNNLEQIQFYSNGPSSNQILFDFQGNSSEQIQQQNFQPQAEYLNYDNYYENQQFVQNQYNQQVHQQNLQPQFKHLNNSYYENQQQLLNQNQRTVQFINQSDNNIICQQQQFQKQQQYLQQHFLNNQQQQQLLQQQNYVNNQSQQQVIEQNNSSCAEILYWFFEFYVNYFDSQTQAVDPFNKNIVNLKNLNNFVKEGKIVIYDPVLPDNDLVQFGKWIQVKELFQCILNNRKSTSVSF